MKRKILIFRIIITLLLSLLMYYFSLPALNLSDPSFYGYVVTIVIIFYLTGTFNLKDPKNFGRSFLKKTASTMIIACVGAGIALIILFINLVQAPLFNSKSWASRITIDSSASFEKEVKEVDFASLPLLDKSSSQKLGDRVMGQMSELVSQFYVSDLYTQINYNNKIVRVTPLEYNGLIKYFNNFKDGVKGYIMVNSVSGDSELVKLENGMKYMPSAYFFQNLYRYIRIKYPTTIFGKESFEIDNEGNPYWVIPTVKYSGVGLKKEINGIVLLNCITGETKKYGINEIPVWIDQVYEASLIVEQVNNWGLYQKGFWNSIFTQNGVVQTTEGYNYTVMNDDVYLYTGITSVSSDESNIGFIMTNLRTKETKFYKVPGAEEYSAMASAEGQVQQMKYKSTFPLLINLNKRPTYLMSLKDDAGLVKMYAFVDVKDYQKVVVTDASLGIEQAYKNYVNNVNLKVDESIFTEKNIKIKEINSAMIDGNTYYYIEDYDNQKYKVSIKVNSNILPFLKSNSSVTVRYNLIEEVIELKKIEK